MVVIWNIRRGKVVDKNGMRYDLPQAMGKLKDSTLKVQKQKRPSLLVSNQSCFIQRDHCSKFF